MADVNPFDPDGTGPAPLAVPPQVPISANWRRGRPRTPVKAVGSSPKARRRPAPAAGRWSCVKAIGSRCLMPDNLPPGFVLDDTPAAPSVAVPPGFCPRRSRGSAGAATSRDLWSRGVASEVFRRRRHCPRLADRQQAMPDQIPAGGDCRSRPTAQGRRTALGGAHPAGCQRPDVWLARRTVGRRPRAPARSGTAPSTRSRAIATARPARI